MVDFGSLAQDFFLEERFVAFELVFLFLQLLALNRMLLLPKTQLVDLLFELCRLIQILGLQVFELLVLLVELGQGLLCN